MRRDDLGPPRLAPCAPDELDAGAADLLAQTRLPGVPAANIFATLIRHPGLFRRWLPFAGKLLAGRLPSQHRELVVLRTGWVCRAEYEWAQHAVLARQSGLSDAAIQRVAAGSDGEGWSDFEATLLRAVDELHDSSTVTDETWETLASIYDERQLIELVMLVGQYHLVSFVANALRLELEEDAVGFPPGYDARAQAPSWKDE